MTYEGTGVRILVADSQSLFREAVKAALRRETDIEVVAEAGDGVQALSEARAVGPDVALLEADLPNGGGIQTTRVIREEVPGCRVLIVSGDHDDRVLLDAMEAGASGYMTKESPLAELIEATKAVSSGSTFVPHHMVRSLLDGLIRRRRAEDEAQRKIARLSRREREALALLAEGANNDRIAQVLVISPQTARTHVQNILAKLGVHSRLEAVAVVTGTGFSPASIATDEPREHRGLRIRSLR